MNRKYITLLIIFLSIILITLLGRNHFLLGTILIMGRWMFVLVGLIFLYTNKIRRLNRVLQLLNGCVLLTILIEYGWNKFNEQKTDNVQATTEVTIMTQNLFFKNKAIQTTIDKIKQHQPDILLVQELTENHTKKLNQSLNKAYPYCKIIALPGAYGLGIYSKYNIQTEQFLRNTDSIPFAQVVTFNINGKSIQLINTHMASPAKVLNKPIEFWSVLHSIYRLRDYQFQKIKNINRKGQYDVQILMGDLNTTRFEPMYRNLRMNWVDLFEVCGKGDRSNFPNTATISPFMTLDYILIKGEVKGITSSVVPGGSSDHLALFGRIKL